MKTWVSIPENSDFTINNIPFGIFSTPSIQPRIGVAIGDQVIDLVMVNRLGVFEQLNIDEGVFENKYLNSFIALGKKKTSKVRGLIQRELSSETSVLRNVSGIFLFQSGVTMHLPVDIGDYTDFYSSIEHATNVGMMFRDPENALLPNWKHLPVGYHGRASSIILSEQKIHRPKGQVLLPNADSPEFQASKRVDFELEMGFIIGKNSNLGESISVEKSKEYIFGKVLFNDWSARDIQKWEYVPLGPFLAKSFASTISPWIVTLDALEPFKVAGPKQDPKPLPYLEEEGETSYDIHLQTSIRPKKQDETIVSNTNFKNLYWSISQQLAHQTINGCNARSGDLYGSGTISGKEKDSFGSMLELTWGGKNPIKMSDGTERKFINDGDSVIMRGHCQNEEVRLGFGECIGKIKKAKMPAEKDW
jgi:fumarylacetoacetase